MKISVIIPCLNHGRLLARKLESLARQTLRPDEIIVVDDGSTVDTEHLKRAEHEGHIKLITLGRNMGVPSACNAGICAAKNEYIFLTALDDELINVNTFALAADAFSKYPCAAYVTFVSQYVEERTGLVWSSPIMSPEPTYYSPEKVLTMLETGGFAAQGQTCVYRKSMFLRHGLYNHTHHWQHDVWCLVDQAYRHGFVAMPNETVRFSIRRGSYSTNGKRGNQQVRALEALIISFSFAPELLDALLKGNFFAQWGLPAAKALENCGIVLTKHFKDAARAKHIKDKIADILPTWLLRLAMQVTLPPKPYTIE